MGRVKDWLVAGSVLALGRRRRRLRHREPPRVVEPHPPRSGSELVAAGAFFFAAVCAVAFIVVYALDRLPAHIQLLGLCLGLCLASIAVAFYVLAMRVVPEEELEGTYEETKPEEQLQVERIVADGTRAAAARPAPAARVPLGLGAGRNPRLLEDLHARRLRDRALSRTEVPPGRGEAGARLPVPLLDLRPHRRRNGDVRPGRPLAPAAAPADRRRRPAARGGQLLRPGGPVVVGRPQPRSPLMSVTRRAVRFVDERTGATPLVRRSL